MLTKQLTVFIENREGRLEDVLDALKNEEVNILSLSLADTSEYGILRLIVDDYTKGKDVLVKAGFSTHLTDVLILKIPHKPGSVQELLKSLADNGINVEYMYGLSIENSIAMIVVKTSDMQKAKELVEQHKLETL